MKVVVVGGGVSGFISAIYASKNGNEVTILERNSSVLKKLLLTGSGKCNYFNDNQSLDNYNTSYINELSNIINEENIKELKDFYDRVGIVPKIKNGYYYPYSGTANSVREALIKEAELCGVEVICDSLVKNIFKESDKFIVSTNFGDFHCDKVIVSTGGASYSKTGSDGMMFDVLNNLGHTVNKVLPALTGLIGDEPYFKDWAGIRSDVKVSLYIDNKFNKSYEGEIQLTNYGVSGICVFNLSGLVSKALYENKSVNIKVNFLPFIDLDPLRWLEERNSKVKNRTIIELLEGVINYKLLLVILKKLHIKSDSYLDNLSYEEKKSLANSLVEWNINIIDTKGLEESQVITGGVPLDEISSLTMESKIINNLYLTGELLDVDGICGGYNLTFAFITGFLAGSNIK